jgi:hypothetical protein
MKNKEALNNTRTGHRLEAVTTQLKSNENNMAVRILYDRILISFLVG